MSTPDHVEEYARALGMEPPLDFLEAVKAYMQKAAERDTSHPHVIYMPQWAAEEIAMVWSE